MSWFEKQRAGRDSEEVAQEHGRYIRAAGVDAALGSLSGPFGVRRFLVHFTRKGARVRVTAIETMPLRWGGGPPLEDTDGGLTEALEKSLTRLHRNMGTGPAWTQGVLGYVRDAQGRVSLFPLFDEDVAKADMARLPVPGPPGHPLEHPVTVQLLTAWDDRMRALWSRTSKIAHNWDSWEILGEHEMRLTFGGSEEGGEPTGELKQVRRHKCRVLATHNPKTERFRWQAEQPIFEEALFDIGEFSSTWQASMEVALLTAARLEAEWLFVQETDGSAGILFVAVWE